MRRFLPAIAALAAAAPQAASAQPFGGRLPETPLAAGEVAPVSIEIRRDGRFFWSGRLDAGRPGDDDIGVSAMPAAFERCFISVGGPVPGTLAQDSLGVRAAVHGPSEARLYSVTVGWAYLVSSLPPGALDFYFCDHRYQSVHSLRFTAGAVLAPGARVRVDAPAGFEVFLARDPDPAAPPPPAPAAPSPPEPAGIPAFDVTIDQAGARLWAGTIYRFGDDLGEVGANYRVPRALSCRAGAERLSTIVRRDGEWTLRMSPDPADAAFGIVFSSWREDSEAGRPPRSCLEGAVRRVEVRLETAIAIPPGRTTILRADDDVAIRIRPR